MHVQQQGALIETEQRDHDRHVQVFRDNDEVIHIEVQPWELEKHDARETRLQEGAIEDHFRRDIYSYDVDGRVAVWRHAAPGKRTVRYACTYDEGGRLIGQEASGGDTTRTTFSYDEAGNLSSVESRFGLGGSMRTFDNKYNKAGRLKKKKTTLTSAGSFSTSTKYAYKKISVPAQFEQAVAEQQWSLLNPQVSFSYPLNY